MLTPPLGLYVHLPWCVQKCPYCDFNSHAVRGELPEAAYLDALAADLDFEAARFAGRRLETVFLGGGTPSLFSAAGIARILERVDATFALASDAEITLEANPGTLEAGRFAGYRAAGVNRLSIGVQSFNDAHLAALGRIHNATQALEAIRAARRAGFARLNLDLMFALPGQTTTQALEDVDTALALAPEQISWYQLTLEPNTLFHRQPPPLPGEDAAWAMQQAGQSRLAAQGYVAYEISAHAAPGGECRHNLNYWLFGDYAAVGAGAHGKRTDAAHGTIERTSRVRHPTDYLRCAGTDAVFATVTDVPSAQRPLEFLMNALRLSEGFAEVDFAARTGLALTALEPALGECQALGQMERVGGRVRCTARGWRMLDSVLERFCV